MSVWLRKSAFVFRQVCEALVRSARSKGVGTSPARLPNSLAQVRTHFDAEEYNRELRSLLRVQGDFWTLGAAEAADLAAYLQALPAGLPLGIEVPRTKSFQAIGGAELIKETGESVRSFLKSLMT